MFDSSEVEYKNDSILEGFSTEEKEMLFDDLAKMYFHKNFGSVSKADLETYLFSFYIEHLLDNGTEMDDYTVGRDLGLTITRVRALKERKELKYPRKGYDWKKEFLEYAKNAWYDEKSGLFKFSVPDVNVMKDARNFFEQKKQYVEYQLNPQLFQCNFDAFITICGLLVKDSAEEFTFELQNQKEILELAEKRNCVDEVNIHIEQINVGKVEDGIKGLREMGEDILLIVLKNVFSSNPIVSSAVDVIKYLVESKCGKMN